MKKIRFLLFLFVMWNIHLQSQTSNATCGLDDPTLANPSTLPGFYSTPGNFFNHVFDRFGNIYRYQDIEVNTGPGTNSKIVSAATTCTAGYFRAYFGPNSGMDLNNPLHSQRRSVICQLLTDLSGFINPSLTTTNPTLCVNIFFDDINNFNTTSSPLGIASPFYVFPNSPSNSSPGVADNMVYKTITTKQDAYYGLVWPLNSSGPGNFYHGVIAFDFSAAWNYTSTPCPSGSYDFYSVAYHEMMHLLGIDSKIKQNGTSVFGTSNNYYSRYDMLLKNYQGNPILSNNSSCTNQYGLYYTGSSNFLGNNCSSSSPPNTTSCSTANHFVGSGVDIPVYTPSCFEGGSSLSHFEDMCFPTNSPANNDLIFVTSNASYQGSIKRYIRPEERLVLCNLGYDVDGAYTSAMSGASYTYSGGPCSSIGIYGVTDGISGGAYTYTSATSTLTFNITGAGGILSNDALSAITATCIETVYNNGAVSVIGNIITFTANTNFFGPILLRYIPVDASGNKGNITYIFGYILPSNCGPTNVCDLIQNQGFENFGSPCGPYLPVFQPLANCWRENYATPDLFGRTCTIFNGKLGVNTYGMIPPLDSHNGSPNNEIVGLGGYMNYTGSSATTYIDESIYNYIGSPLIPGTGYKLTFWANQYVGPFTDGASNVSVVSNPNAGRMVITFATYSSNIAPTIPPLYLYPNPGLQVLQNCTLSANGFNNWQQYSYTFTYTPSNSQNGQLLFIGINSTLNPQSIVSTATAVGTPTSNYNYYVAIDDISLVPLNNALTISNVTICPTSVIPNLNVVSSQPNTVFSGPGVTLNGSNYVFTPSGIGNYTITGTYTNTSSGCVYSGTGIITVGSPSLNLSASAYTTCPNYTVALFAPGSIGNYTWQPGSIYSPTAIVTPTANTTYTLYNDVYGCLISNTIAINTLTVAPYTVSATSTTICSGNSTTLSAGGGTGTYLWQPGNITGNNISVSPLSTTIYTVSTLNDVGCKVISFIQINVIPVVDFSIAATSSFACVSNAATLSAIPAGYSYTWSPGSVNATSVAVSPSITTTYTASALLNGCIYSKTINVTSVPCTCLLPELASLSGTLTYGTPALASGAYKVVGDLVVNFGLTQLQNVELIFYPGTKLTVLNGSPGPTLSLVGSYLHGCGDLWEGIKIEGLGAKAEAIPQTSPFKTTLIEDAKIAIEVLTAPTHTWFAPSTSILNIDNTTFNKNLTGIKINTYTLNPSPSPFVIKNSLFTSRKIPITGVSSPTYVPIWPTTSTVKNSASGATTPLQTPYIDNAAYTPTPVTAASILPAFPDYGIVLDRVGLTNTPGGGGVSYYGITIGGGTTNEFNCFDNLKEDLNASNSNFKVVNSVFQNGVRYGGRQGYAYGGRAIVANSTTNDVINYNNRVEIINGGANGAYPVRFYDKTACADITGYLSNNIQYAQAYSSQNSYSYLNSFNTVGDHGFSIKTNRYQNITLENNQLYNIKNTMLVSLDNGYYSIGNVSGNGRYVGYISAQNNTVDRVPSATVTVGGAFINSALSIADPFSSANVVYVAGVSVYANVNNNNFKNVHNGVDVSNVSFCQVGIYSNTITMVNEPNSWVSNPIQKGINAVQLLNTSSINQNRISGVSTYSSGVKAITTAGNALMAVRCNTVANTARGLEFNGIQTLSMLEDNDMSNHTYGLVLDNSAKLTSTLSTFVMGTASRPTNNVWNGTWAAPKYKTGTLGGSSAQNGKLYVQFGNGLLDPDNSGYTDGSYNLADYFYPGTNATLLQATTTVAIGCRIGGGGGNRTSSEGGTDNVVALLEQTTTDSVMYDVTTPEAAFINQNLVYRTIAANSDLMNESSSLNNFFINSQGSSVKTIFDLENVVASQATNASSQLNTFSPSNQVESNYKLFYSIYLRTKDSTYTSNDSLMLVDLANSCSYTQGSVVHQARSLYNGYYTTYKTFDDNCGNVSSRKINKAPKEEPKVILKSQLYPNPNNGNYMIRFGNITEKQSVEISIFDFNGKQVYKETRLIESSEVKLYNNLLNGVYTVRIKLPDGTYDAHKLIINK